MEKELKSILKISIYFVIIFIITGWVLGNIMFYTGIIVGSILSVFNFLLLYRDAKNITYMGLNPKKTAMKGYLIRYLFSFLVLSACIVYKFDLFLGAASGIFLIKIIIYIREALKVINKILNKIKP